MARPINQKLAKELRSMDIITYTFFSMFALLVGYVVFALMFVLILISLRFLLILSVAIVANTFSTSAFCSAGVRGFGAR
jgi:hypothetical protein